MATAGIASQQGTSGASGHKKSCPAWASLLMKSSDFFMYGVGSNKTIVLAWAINFHKIFTLFLILGFMFFYDNFSLYAWVYLGLHGIYGYCWLIKDFNFRDPSFEDKISWQGAVLLYLTLIGWYWLVPWLFISQQTQPENWVMFVAIAIHTIGISLMLSADCQKHFQLKYKKGLMTNGVFKYTRNPNFLGEIMIYATYAILANHWIGYLVTGYAFLYFFARMLRKDHSISRYPEWDEYAKASSILIPWKCLIKR